MRASRCVWAFVALAVAVRADTWIWSEPEGHAPQPRFEHSANRIGNEVFVFGGTLSNDVREADLHVLSIDDMSWRKPETTGNKPGPTMGHSTVVDGDSMYVLFGSNGRMMNNRVYHLNTHTFEWSRVPPEGRVPTPRSYHSSHAVDGEVWTFGGFDGRFYLNDLHKWSLENEFGNGTGAWTKLEQHGVVPEVRASAASAIYGRKMYLFGGFEVAIYKNDFFVLDLDTVSWSRIHLSRESSCAMPGPRAMASLTLVGTQLVLFGGIYCSSNGTCTELADAHHYDIYKSSFADPNPTGIAPPARYGHTGTLTGSKVLVFGGAAWPNLYNDILLYDVYDSKWTMAKNLPPYSRKQHSLTLVTPDDAADSYLLSFGGKHGSGGYSQNLHKYSMASARWSHPTPNGVAPPPVGHHSAAVKDNQWLYVFGGYNGTHSNNDVYLCDLTTLTWEKVDVDGHLPPPSHGHATVTGSGQWLQFGGVDCQGEDCSFYNELHSLSHETLSWERVATEGSTPRPRASHSFTSVSRTSHLLFGGIGPYFSNYNDLYVYDEPTKSWGFVDAKGAKPEPRYGHTAAEYRGMLVVFGGAACRAIGDCSYYNDVRMFVPATRTWSLVTVQGDYPAARVGAAMVLNGEIAYLMGGATNDRMFGELLTMEPDFTVPARSIVHGAGKEFGTAGKNVKFFVQNQDSFRVNRTTGGDHVEAVVRPTSRLAVIKLAGEKIQVHVEDGLNGQYKVEYATTVADKYNVTVRVNGEALPTFATDVVADLASPAASKAKGPGLTMCVAGEECWFNVEQIDQYGNRLARKSPLDVQFVGPKRVAKKLKDAGDGNTKVSYTPERAGVYNVHVRIRTEEMAGSPFRINVTHAAASPLTSRADGDGLAGAVAGDPGLVMVTLFDAFDNPIVVGGDGVKGELLGPDELACAVTDMGNGTYAVSYTAIKIGEYQLNLVLNDEPMAGSPFDVKVANAPLSAAATYAYGAGLRYSIAGYRAYFTIQAADDFGNNMTSGGAQFNALFAGPGDYKQMCDLTDHGDGRYTASYESTVAGDFMLSLTLWNEAMGYQSIHLSPFLGTTVAAGASPVKSYVYMDEGKPLESSGVTFRSVMGVHNYFHIQAVDRYGNKKTTGGDRFTAELEGPVTHDGFISDNGDGTYVGTYVAPAAGKYWLKIFYGNVPLAGTPFRVMVRSNFDDCPNACSNNGECHHQECVCFSGFTGADCSVETGNCMLNCMGNGACLNNTCYCYPGFTGPSCADATTLCPNDCSKHGACVDAQCICDDGYTGVDCSDNTATCPDGCRGNGECVNGTCLCYPGFKGHACETKSKFCPKGCSGRGKCMSSGMCSCFAGWTGLDCADQLDVSLAQKSVEVDTKHAGMYRATEAGNSKAPPAPQQAMGSANFELPAKLSRKH